MRAILTILVLCLLSGCANHSQPLYDDSQRDYYQGGDLVYSGSTRARYLNMGVYPWWSMDYFYLGYQPYRPWPYAYYSPFFYPHYFSVLYPPWHWSSHYWYGEYHAWRDPYWHHRYRHYSGSAFHQPQETGDYPSRMVVAPSGHYGGMTVISPENRKERPSRVSPTTSAGITATINPYPSSSAGQFRPSSSASGIVAPATRAGKTTIPVSKTPAAKTTPPVQYPKNRPVRHPSPSPGRSSTRSSTIPSVNINTSRQPVERHNPDRNRE